MKHVGTVSAQTKINRVYCIMQQSFSQPGYERFVQLLQTAVRAKTV